MTIDDLMKRIEDELLNDPQIQHAIQEVQGIILARYPDTRFDLGVGDDPIGVHITATVDVEDPDDVIDLYIKRLLEIQVEERLPVYVIAVQPMPSERRAAAEKKYRQSA